MSVVKGKIVLKRAEENRLVLGHPWIFDNEIQNEQWDRPCSEFPVVDIYSSQKVFLGTALYSPQSKIKARLLSRNDILPDREFFLKRIVQAGEYRKQCGFLSSMRLVFAEADWLPGLIVDRFDSVLSVQILCYGMEFFKQMIFDLLTEVFKPQGIVERSDVDIRSREGLLPTKGLVYGMIPEPLLIDENGLKLEVDVMNGQKTGHFLDQCENHRKSASYARGGKVLDLFCHTGGFGLAAALAGAESVTGVDISATALEKARINSRANGLQDRMSFVEANVFDYLRGEQKGQYDLVIVDPPAFAKSRSRLEQALRGYRDVNWHAMKLVKNGGWFVSCSCSFAVRPEYFEQVLTSAAAEAGRRIRLVEKRTAALDHPCRLGYEESDYLKCFIMQVFDED